MIIIPWIFIYIIIAIIIGGVSKVLDVNIMPFISFPFLILGIIGIFNTFRAPENEKKVHLIMAIIGIVIFLFTIGSNVSTGDALSWIWHHI